MDRALEQSTRVLLGESVQPHLGQAHQITLVGGLANREHHPKRLRRQPASNKAEDLPGGPVKPLSVVHETQQRALVRHLCHEAERR